MNKYFQQGLLTAMLVSLVACGGGSGSGGSKNPSSSANSAAPSSTPTSSVAESSSSPAEASSSVDAGSSLAASSAPASVDSSSSEDASSSTTSSSAISSSASSSSVPALTGVFVDSAVAGIGYRTETKNGFTNNLGEYEYEEGETVTFFIGDLELPPVTAKGVVTPLDLAGTDDLSNPVVVNIARLLQSLDTDGDTSNGIQIPPGATSIATAADFDVPVEIFAANQAITTLVANSGSSTQTLVSVEAAIAHLQGSIAEQAFSLIGSWYYQDESNSNPTKQFHIILSFLDNNRYVIANDEDDEDDAGTDGFEQGSYTWNQRTHLLEITVENDTNGEWGFSHPCEGEVFKVEVRGDTLMLWADAAVGEGCGDSNEGPVKIEFQRIKSETNPLVGSWLIEDKEEPLLALATFTADGQYLMLQDSPADDAGWPGIERGTYTYNTDTSGVTFATITDTNGQWGFSHPCAVLSMSETQWQGSNDLSCGAEGADIVQSMTRTGNTLAFISEADTINNGGEPEPVVFVGIGTTQANIVLELEVTNTVTEATLGELFTVEGASMQCGAHEFDEIGDSETFPETWTLNPNYGGISTVSDEKYVTDEPYTDNGKFDVITGKLHVSYEGPIVNLCESGEATCSNGVVFYNQNIWSWVADVNFDPDAEPVATGEIIDTHRLTWNQGPEVSVCTIRASVNATRLP